MTHNSNSLTEDQISLLVSEGGNATSPEIDLPKAFLFKCLNKKETKVFLSTDSLFKAVLECASEHDCLAKFETLINHKKFSELEAECPSIDVQIQAIQVVP